MKTTVNKQSPKKALKSRRLWNLLGVDATNIAISRAILEEWTIKIQFEVFGFEVEICDNITRCMKLIALTTTDFG